VELGLGKQGQVTPFWQFGFLLNNHFSWLLCAGQGPKPSTPRPSGAAHGLPLARAVQKGSLHGAGGGGGPSSRGRRCRAALEASSLQFSRDKELDACDHTLWSACSRASMGGRW
jgi:hypothetical protein